MKKYVIEGGKKLEGTTYVSGSKNASLPIIAATLLNGGILDDGDIKSKSFDIICSDEGRVHLHGEVIEEKCLTSEHLISMINEVLSDTDKYNQMKENLKKMSMNNSSDLIYKKLKDLIK